MGISDLCIPPSSSWMVADYNEDMRNNRKSEEYINPDNASGRFDKTRSHGKSDFMSNKKHVSWTLEELGIPPLNNVEQQPDIIQSKKTTIIKSEKTTCACGATVNTKGLKKHLRTKKHRKYVEL